MSIQRAQVSLLVASLVLAGACAPRADPAEAEAVAGGFALRGVTVLPMNEEIALEDQTVVVGEGSIRAVGPAAEVEIPSGVEVIDGTGLFVMPGLWDLHVHLGQEEALPLYLANGVTTIANLGGDEEALEQRSDLAEGRLTGPSLLTCGPMMHGHAVDITNVAERVAEIAADGYDCVKVYSDWEEDVYRAAADAAAAADILFIGHAPRNLPFDVVLDDGREEMVHLEEMVYTTVLDDWLDLWREGVEPGPGDDPRVALEGEVRELARRMAERDVWVIATQIVIDNYLARASEEGRARLAARPYLRYVDPIALRTWEGGNQDDSRIRFEQQVALQHFMLEVFRQEGVPMAAGTDAMLASNLQVVPGWSLHEELGILVSTGFSPYEALRQATVDAAAFMRRPGEGVIAPGAPADLLVLASNPLENIENASDIVGVAAAGRWHSRADLEAGLAAVEAGFVEIEQEVALLDEAFAEGIPAVAGALQGLEAPSERLTSYVESRVNRLGYQELGEERLDEAIEIFAANVEMFPQSANTYDSLAEAYLTRGDRELAIEWYERALEVDPGFSNARQMLEEIAAPTE